MKLMKPPVSLQPDGLHSERRCLSVNISADGHLMCWTEEGIEIRNADTLDTISTVKHTSSVWWAEIIQPKDVMVGVSVNEEDKSAEVVILNSKTLQKTRSVYKYSLYDDDDDDDDDDNDDDDGSSNHDHDDNDHDDEDDDNDDISFEGIPYRIAQQDSTVYIVDIAKKELVLCSLVDDTVLKFPLPGMKMPLPVCILPDSTLLIGDFTEDGKVRRYKVENTTLTLMWEFLHISLPSGISFDPTSVLIYICTYSGPLLILSLEGRETHKHYIISYKSVYTVVFHILV